MSTKMPAAQFVDELIAAYDRKDGYIMGATGQNPKKWATSSWWFTQYSGSQRAKALYWREHAQRVWDCNGLAEGIYKDFSGTDINTKCRYNYSGWCSQHGSGMIPPEMRVPGAAVFWGDSAAKIHHVAYLIAPIGTDTSGDWWMIEARGVMYGVVKTKLLSRKPNYWGLMDAYFDYGAAAKPKALGDRVLCKGSSGADVTELQTRLTALGYDFPRYGIDGDFGSETQTAVKAFQRDFGVNPDGVFDADDLAALIAAENGTTYNITIKGVSAADAAYITERWPDAEAVPAEEENK